MGRKETYVRVSLTWEFFKDIKKTQGKTENFCLEQKFSGKYDRGKYFPCTHLEQGRIYLLPQRGGGWSGNYSERNSRKRVRGRRGGLK